MGGMAFVFNGGGIAGCLPNASVKKARSPNGENHCAEEQKMRNELYGLISHRRALEIAFLIGPVLAWTGCTPVVSERRAPPPLAHPAGDSNFESPPKRESKRDLADVLAERAMTRGIDCPLTPKQRTALSRYKHHYGQRAELVRAVACACKVIHRCRSMVRPKFCRLKQAVEYFQRRMARGKDRKMADLLGWAVRLFKKRHLKDPQKLSRLVPLKHRPPRPTDREIKKSDPYRQMKKNHRRIVKLIRQRSFFQIKRTYKNSLQNLKVIENGLMCGKRSAVARALFDRTKKLALGKIRAFKKVRAALRRNTRYQALKRRANQLEEKARRIGAERQIRDHSRYCAHHPKNRSKLCRLQSRKTALLDQLNTIQKRYEQRFGLKKVSGTSD
jgi:hypothetical protein